MCGIAGFFDRRAATGPEQARSILAGMDRALFHRGPDSGGHWFDGETGIGLAHRRLSIVDLSPAGHQPMVSADGRLVLSYNGEIYNAEELRARLAPGGVVFKGHSDTEAILEHCAAFGVLDTVSRLIGMFAFALWDRREKRLWLGRDRLGKKPLYWGRLGDLVLFGSELKSLRAHPGWSPEIDRQALGDFMRFGYVPAPASIYRHIGKLPAGALAEIDAKGEKVSLYWDARQMIAERAPDRRRPLAEDAADRLERLLKDAVARRMVADVPLGAFLSGGVDSSLTAALMQAQSARPIRSFSIGFGEAGYDEAPYAKAVAAHLGTEHTEFYVTARDALETVPDLPVHFDEPFADSSQIPTLLLSRLARAQVTVALSGDGGDELFAGYNRYLLVHRLWRRLARLPAPLRAAAARLLEAVPPGNWDRWLKPVLPRGFGQPGDKIHKLAAILALPDVTALYRRLVSQWPEPERLVPGYRFDPAEDASDDGLPGGLDDVERLQALDLLTYLPDDILVKVDRASMAVALEMRAPLLDHRVAEFAWSLPPEAKIRGGTGKWLLRQVLYRHVPQDLIERPKMGFGVPIDSWLRGPLRDWAEDLLDPARMAAEGYLDPGPVAREWRLHLRGGKNRQHALWTVLMFQAWLRQG